MFVAWIALAVAIASEIVATLSLKAAGGGSVGAVALVVIGYVASFALMLVVLRRIEVSVAYAIWAGAGTAAIAVIGVAFLGEQADVLKFASIALVIAGVVGLNLGGAH
ncbi:QacE family quaternary ammonium compound efflux SMR transporter [Baekduia soli]|uniref:QacE family quaternary ammonium compound efflux SMR transporter n=1 Tax=Baekduia soli TaxID=496014 RepID=A0A5B8U0N0_9ACTN|nr:SMR family transporter [Baekduia soli]QEC46546.1 QacE family quaternary ammonium compound efflux SMR transporter [Baekduia soli]